MLLFYIRHGEPIYNPDKLTELGHKQAKALSKRLVINGLDEIYVSSSNRAIETARPTANALNINPVILDWMNEKYAWEEFTKKDENGNIITWVFQDDDFINKLNSKEVKNLGFRWFEHDMFKDYKFKDGIKRIDENTDLLMEGLGYIHKRDISGYISKRKNNKRVAIFAHQGFGMAFLSSLLDVPYPYMSTHFDLCHSSMTVIYFDENKDNGEIVIPKVLELSNDSHLYKEGLLKEYTKGIKI